MLRRDLLVRLADGVRVQPLMSSAYDLICRSSTRWSAN
jgi:hypothetical protein